MLVVNKEVQDAQIFCEEKILKNMKYIDGYFSLLK